MDMDAENPNRVVSGSTVLPSRRVALGLGLGGVWGALGLTTGAAKKRKKNKKKNKSKNTVCRTTIRCADREIDPETDAANCGECGSVCSSGICVSGRCRCVDDDDCPESCVGCYASLGGGAEERYCVGDGMGFSCASNADCGRAGICDEISAFGGTCLTACYG